MTNAKKTVLLVEDGPDVRLGLRIDLEENGKYSVWEADDHPQAINILRRRGAPDIVITDIIMPSSKKAGFHLIEEMKANERWRDIPVIVLSAKTASMDILEALRLGACDYLVKPCQLSDLLERTSRAYRLSLRLSAESGSDNGQYPPEKEENRQLHVDTLKLALLYWEMNTLTSKIELAETSKLWTTHVTRGGTFCTRTLDKYLHIKTLPQNPKTRLVLQTARFVLQNCPEDPELKPKLEAYIEKLTQANSQSD